MLLKVRKKGSSWYKEIVSRTSNFQELFVDDQDRAWSKYQSKLIYLKFSTCYVIKYKESCAKKSLSKNSSCLNEEKNNRPANDPHNPQMRFRLHKQRCEPFKFPKLVR